MGKVDARPGGCWLWLGGVRRPYGEFYWGRRDGGGDLKMSAHRASFTLFKGRIPPGMHVCHSCDVPLCVNPGHLFLGTALDNVTDARTKGRASFGERAGQAKLTWDQVREIRRRAPATEREFDATSAEFGVARRTIYRILRGETWSEPSTAVEHYLATRRNPRKGPRRHAVSG